VAILFTEGFDTSGSGDGVTYGKWSAATNTHTGAGSSNTRGLTTGRFGSGSALTTSGNGGISQSTATVQITFQLASDVQTIFCGFAFQTRGSSANLTPFALLDNLGGSQLDIRIDAGLHVLVTRQRHHVSGVYPLV
jgi:hypothetical protein